MVIFYHGDMDGIAAANLYINKISSVNVIRAIEFEYDKQPLILIR